jgi:hypothetical protein
MRELPIVVETSLWLNMLFGAALLIGSAALARSAASALRSGSMTLPIAMSFFGAMAAFALGIAVGLQKLNWQFRLDEKGITLKAPFDYWQPGMAIAWPELSSIRVSNRGYRGPSHKLVVVGKNANEIVVTNADLLPEAFGTMLEALLRNYAPQAKGATGIAAELADARNNRAAYLASGYTVRNGRGELLH